VRHPWHRAEHIPDVPPVRIAQPTHGRGMCLAWRQASSLVVARANGARTSVRRKVGKRRNLGISKRRSPVPVFLRDKSRAPGRPWGCALNRYRARRPCHYHARRPHRASAIQRKTRASNSTLPFGQTSTILGLCRKTSSRTASNAAFAQRSWE